MKREIPTTCPKCGDMDGFWHVNPKYIRGSGPDDELDLTEHLEYTCKICGYTQTVPTADTDEIVVG